MIALIQLLTFLYCAALVAAAIEGEGALHDSVVTMALSVALIAVIRQLAILVLSALHRRRTRREQPGLSAEVYPRISIIVPAFNEAKVIEAALESMLALSYPNLEILVIDDGSTDDTHAIVRRLCEGSDGRMRVFRQRNQGKSQALNLGLRISRNPFVLCVDADSTIEPGGLEKAVCRFHDPAVAAVAGEVRVRLGKRSGLLTRLQRTEYLLSQRLTRSAIAWFRCIPIVPGPAGLFRRQALVDAGGYRTSTSCYAEDAELTIRLLSRGHNIESEPALMAVTEAPADLYSLLRQRYRWSRGSIQALFLNAQALVLGRSARGPLLFLFLLGETIFLPTLCFGLALFFLASTVSHGVISSFAIGLLVLVSLEVIGLLVVSDSKRHFPIYLVEYLLIRFFYAYVLTAWTLMCLRDEMSAESMSWDKLERQGVDA